MKTQRKAKEEAKVKITTIAKSSRRKKQLKVRIQRTITRQDTISFSRMRQREEALAKKQDISNEPKVEIPIQPERKSIPDLINECKKQFPPFLSFKYIMAQNFFFLIYLVNHLLHDFFNMLLGRACNLNN